MNKSAELIAAVKGGNAARVAELLDQDRSLLTAQENGASAILLAIYHGKPQIARLFVERGAELSFHEACALGEIDRVRRLLAEDRSLLQAYSADGFPPLGFATFFGHPEVDRFLLDEGADVHAQSRNAQQVGVVHAAASVRNHEMMKLFLERGADPNARQQMDYTALHGAAGQGDIEMGKILLSHGADPKAKSSDGKTPAEVAREHGQAEFAEWLEEQASIAT